MKKITFIVVLLVTGISFSQSGSSFGIKGGLNYGSNGDIVSTVEDSYENPDGNIGFHLGVYGKLGNRLYFKPELVYTQTSSDYDGFNLKIQKLDAPLLFGMSLIGPVDIFAGPSLQLILDTDFEDIDIASVENDFTVGFNFGLAVNIGKLGIDLRYERGFSSNEADFIYDTSDVDITGKVDTRPEQLILSFSYDL